MPQKGDRLQSKEKQEFWRPTLQTHCTRKNKVILHREKHQKIPRFPSFLSKPKPCTRRQGIENQKQSKNPRIGV